MRHHLFAIETSISGGNIILLGSFRCRLQEQKLSKKSLQILYAKTAPSITKISLLGVKGSEGVKGVKDKCFATEALLQKY